MTVTVYGISNCDSVKKARRWLDEHGIAYRFHDYKRDGIAETKLNEWMGQVGREVLLNRRGTTWRSLTDAEKEVVDDAKAVHLMQAHTSLIKRPVIEHEGPLLVGYDAEAYLDAELEGEQQDSVPLDDD